jgi:membrane protease YdiL (CAAX protease family)
MKTLLKHHQIIAFFLFSYALAWIVWVPAISFWRLRFAPDQFPWWFFPSYLIGAWSPTLAALILTRVLEGKTGIKTLLRKYLIWRVELIWYIAALKIAPMMVLLAIRIYAARGGIIGPVAPERWYFFVAGPLVNIVFGGALAEELGWRGFALPALQHKYNALVSSVILGILWALWHAPAYWAPSGSLISGKPVTVSAIGFYILFTIGLTIIMTWLFNNANGSVLLTIMFHAMFNAGFPLALFSELSAEAIEQIIRLCVIPIWGLCILLIILFGPKRLSLQSTGA